MSDISRRGLLKGAGAALAGGSIAGQAVAEGAAAVAGKGGAAKPGARALQDVVLDVQWLETTIAGTRVKLRTYNGETPGPLLEIEPGETLRILLRNHLTDYDSSDWGGSMNVPHKLNTTNLHLHGLEIIPHLFAPVGTSDAAAKMIAVEPGESFQYEFEIPPDQPGGLFWYHPHHHGSTAVQAGNGLAGALIVKGPVDEVPEIKAARDIVLAIQDLGLFPSEDDPEVWTYNPNQNAIWETYEGKVRLGTGADPQWTDLQGGFTTGDYKLRYYMVNGKPFFKEVHNPDFPVEPKGTQLGVPRYTLRPGEVVRFRMLNATTDNLMPIIVEGHEMHLIALDGVNFGAPRTMAAPAEVHGSEAEAQVLLAAANRAEFLIKASSTAGTYRIAQLQQSEQFLFSDFKVIAEIEVTGDPVDMDLPTALPLPTRHYPLIKESEVVRRRTAIFAATFRGPENPIVGLDFMVNGTLYDEMTVEEAFDDCVLGTAEEWTLKVPDMEHGGNEGHPFHIHTNSFEVISIGDKPVPAGTIQDTIWVHKDSDVVIRMEFKQWTGKGVFHCHILPHEDTGMMKNFRITKKKT